MEKLKAVERLENEVKYSGQVLKYSGQVLISIWGEMSSPSTSESKATEI